MLLEKGQKIEDMIVEALAVVPNVSAKELTKHISQTVKEVSLQAVYQELRKLERAGVVMRHKKRYSLGLHWVLELASFVDTLYDRYTQPDVIGILPSEDEPTKTWKFHSIASAVPFWTHMVLCMAQDSEERVCYEYVDHVWFHLVSSAVENQFVKAMNNLGLTHFLAVGGDTFLDKLYANEIEPEKLTLTFGKRPLTSDSDNYISCVGSYILKIKPSKTTLPVINNFFASTVKSEDLKAGAVSDFVKQRCSIKMTLENNPKKAEKIKRAFRRYFGDVVKD